MFILTIRTDNPEAEIGLFSDGDKLVYQQWHAHRELSVTIHRKITETLAAQGKQLADLQGIICFAGPGSFTGLRIGITVGNALAYGLDIPIIAAKGDGWIATGADRLLRGERDKIALPEYGAPVHITQQKK